MDVRRKLAKHVRHLRNARELTQEQLAQRSGLSVDAIRDVEIGSFSPSLSTLAKLASGLSVSLSTFFHGVEDGERDLTRELCDFLSTRSRSEVTLALRVMQALFGV